MAFTTKILLWRLIPPPEYCRLFAQKKAYQGGVTGTPGPPLATPLQFTWIIVVGSMISQLSDIKVVFDRRDVLLHTFSTDSIRQTYWLQKTNVLKKQGALGDTNY